jgi:hypothetical protein
MTLSLSESSKWPDFSGFETFDTKDNSTLIRARNTLKRLSELIIENNWPLNVPMIVWLHGKPGLWKSHLINAFELAIERVPWIKAYRPNRQYWFSQHQSKYRWANVIIFDDLFQEFQSIEDVFTIDSFLNTIKDYEVRSLPEFIFDLYDGKKLWVVSSNFDIKDILSRIGEMDKQGRLKSRIDHLLASTWVLQLEWEDHRKVLAETGTRFKNLFDSQ